MFFVENYSYESLGSDTLVLDLNKENYTSDRKNILSIRNDWSSFLQYPSIEHYEHDLQYRETYLKKCITSTLSHYKNTDIERIYSL